MFKAGTHFLQIQRFNRPVEFIFKQYGVRISHGNSDKMIFLPVHFYLFKQFRGLNRFSHIHGDGRHFSVLHLHIEVFDPRRRLNADLGPVYDMMVIGIFPHAADSVAAHGASGAVQVVHIHLTVRHIRRFNQNQAVGTDSEMTVAHRYRQPGRILHLLLKTVHIYIVIADSLHLCKFHIILSSLILRAHCKTPNQFIVCKGSVPSWPPPQSPFHCPCCISADICAPPAPSCCCG